MNMEGVNECMHGPLDKFRDKKTFDCEKLKLYMKGEEVIKYENDLTSHLENINALKHNVEPLTHQEQRYNTFKQVEEYKRIQNVRNNFKINLANTRIMHQLSPSCLDKNFVNHIHIFGTEKHKNIIKEANENKIIGCFCSSEIASNHQAINTNAIYNKKHNTFTIKTPNFQSAKCWSNNLSQTATHAVIEAQVEVDGKNYGLQYFVVRIRDVNTLLPLAGVIIGDMGEKIEDNGGDHGFMVFNNYEVPKDCLLDRFFQVNDDSVCIFTSEDVKCKENISKDILSWSRINDIAKSECLGTKALTIAVRYNAVCHLLENPYLQCKLIPYLSSAFIFNNIISYLSEVQENTKSYSTTKTIDVSTELHAIACGAKAISSWTMRDAIQNSKEACGSHGFLKASGFGDLRNTQDPIQTYVGENYVILREAGNFLIKLWPLIRDNKKITSPLQSLDFLSNANDILMNSKFTIKTLDELFDQNYILFIYDWLVVYLLKTSSQKLEENSKVLSNFWAQADNQIFHAKDLAVAYIERFFLTKFRKLIDNAPDDEIREVLSDIFYLYAVWSLKNHLAVLYQGGFACGASITSFFNEGILVLLKKVKNNAVALVDVIAPPDFILNSVLGHSDGQVYKRLESALYRFPSCFSRPKWWKEVLCDKLVHKL